MAEHTPGPWRTVFGESTKVADAIGNTVAWLTQTYLLGRRSAKEVGDNAHLIAAAPDMLEALEAIIERFGDFTRAPSIQKARAAIRKAKGDQ